LAMALAKARVVVEYGNTLSRWYWGYQVLLSEIEKLRRDKY
jgi:hypothetical protein